MKPILFGAVLAVLWLLFGLPTALPAALVTLVCQPVILAFAAGLVVRPHLPRVGGWAR
ncbi:hypothetical protein [Streptomyces sp. NTH33]|uniref:hypothetical protein n=1 Tax=Streptomyces sp. NTH33 TaxID=1735453 RepID=UPI0015E8EA6C|nr:hypothetical protein [Streptomyces sp. NTH33]